MRKTEHCPTEKLKDFSGLEIMDKHWI